MTDKLVLILIKMHDQGGKVLTDTVCITPSAKLKRSRDAGPALMRSALNMAADTIASNKTCVRAELILRPTKKDYD